MAFEKIFVNCYIFDTNNLAAIYVANNLLNENIEIYIHDPKVKRSQVDFDLSNLNPNYDKSLVNFKDDPLSDISEHNIIAIITEWDEFKDYNWKKIYTKIKKPAYIFDGRNILEVVKIRKIGFNYIGIGRT